MLLRMNQSIGNNNMDEAQCSVVGLLGILIQVSLGILSFSVLIIKRYFEHPRRPWKIWSFDTVKQIISQLLAHFINLTISLALTSEDPDSDTCLWYFITNIFDNTVGVLICVFSLRIIEKKLYKLKKYELISGNYYEIQEQRRQGLEGVSHQVQEQVQFAAPITIINYKAWLLQLVIWIAIAIVAKITLFGLQILFQNELDFASKFLLGWIEKYPKLQLVAVIVIVPVIMNGFAFWVQDNFLKKRPIPRQEQNQGGIQLQNQSTKNSTPNYNEAAPQMQKLQKDSNIEDFSKKQQIIPTNNE